MENNLVWENVESGWYVLANNGVYEGIGILRENNQWRIYVDSSKWTDISEGTTFATLYEAQRFVVGKLEMRYRTSTAPTSTGTTLIQTDVPPSMDMLTTDKRVQELETELQVIKERLNRISTALWWRQIRGDDGSKL